MSDRPLTEEKRAIVLLVQDMAEQERVSGLTNQQLVEELLNADVGLDFLIEEDPEWLTREVIV